MSEVVPYYKQDKYEENSVGRATSALQRYHVSGVADQSAAIAAAKAQVPQSLNGMSFDQISVDEDLGNGNYSVSVRYKFTNNPFATTPAPAPGTSVFVQKSYDISGGTEVRKYAIKTIWSSLEAPQDNWNMVNVDNEGNVAGIAVPITETSYSEVHTFRKSDVTTDYLRKVQALRGSVNNVAFRGWEAGECRFDGVRMVSKKDGAGEWWEITFLFKISVNASVTLGGRWTTLKRGWDYGWVCYRRRYDPVTKVIHSEPVYARVQQVLEYANFNVLNIDKEY